MQKELIIKFLNFKQRSLLAYADILSQNYFENNSKLWTTPQELYNLLNSLFKIYISNYYFQTIDNKDRKDIEMSQALNTLKEHYQDSFDKIKAENQKTIYILITIIYVVNRIDKEISYYKHDSTLTSNIIDKLKDLLKDELTDLNINGNHFILNLLANKIKDNERKERQFFEKVFNKEIFINFHPIENKTYLINIDYDIPTLGSYNDVIINKVYGLYNIESKLMKLAIDFICVAFIKMYANDITIPKLIVEVPASFLESDKDSTGFYELLELDFINKHLTLAIKSSNYQKYANRVSELTNHGIAILIDSYNGEIFKKEESIYIHEKLNNENPEIYKELDKNNYKVNIIKKEKLKKLDDIIYENIEEEK